MLTAQILKLHTHIYENSVSTILLNIHESWEMHWKFYRQIMWWIKSKKSNFTIHHLSLLSSLSKYLCRDCVPNYVARTFISCKWIYFYIYNSSIIRRNLKVGSKVGDLNTFRSQVTAPLHFNLSTPQVPQRQGIHLPINPIQWPLFFSFFLFF